MIQCHVPETSCTARSEGLPLNNDQRLWGAHGLRDLAHFAAAALIFGQAFAGKFFTVVLNWQKTVTSDK